MSLGARFAVFVLSIIMFAALIAPSVSLLLEFGSGNDAALLADMLRIYSFLFVFPPLFGVVVLIAFYVPGSLFVDMFCRHVRYGSLQLLIGILVLGFSGFIISRSLTDDAEPALWKISPALTETRSSAGTPLASYASDLTEKSQQRLGLQPFARDCVLDPLVPVPNEFLELRYCFANKRMSTGSECCTAQNALRKDVIQLSAANGSITKMVVQTSAPIVITFFIAVVGIIALLATRMNTIVRNYPQYAAEMERTMTTVSFLLLPFPLAYMGFIQGNEALFGGEGFGGGIMAATVFLGLVLFTIGLTNYVQRDHDMSAEEARKSIIFGAIGNGIFVFNFDWLSSAAQKTLAAGMNVVSFAVLIGLCVFAVKRIVAIRSRSAATKRF